ncbi:MAG: hypothetical protein WC494_00585 [Candidatus Pacearchaeota archaeon]
MSPVDEHINEKRYLCPNEGNPLIRLPTGHHKCPECGRELSVKQFAEEVLHCRESPISEEDEKYLTQVARDFVSSANSISLIHLIQDF